MHRLANQHQVCVERARTCTHAIDILVIARKLDRQVGYPIFEHIDMHFAGD